MMNDKKIASGLDINDLQIVYCLVSVQINSSAILYKFARWVNPNRNVDFKVTTSISKMYFLYIYI